MCEGTQGGDLEREKKEMGWKFRSPEQSQITLKSLEETYLIFVVFLKSMEILHSG